MTLLTKLGIIAAGGAIGAILRYGLAGWTHSWAGPGFPWGTLLVNVVGCFAIGLLWSLSERAPIDPRLAAFLFIGVLGSFTTFSTFGLETINLVRSGETAAALLNIALANGLALIAVVAGLLLGRGLIPGPTSF